MGETRVLRDGELPAGSERRLLKYVLTAGAGMLAASTPADASLVYTDVPDVTHTNTGFSLDLNGDGSFDVTFQNGEGGGYSWGFRSLSALTPSGGGVVAPSGAWYTSALALTQSASITPGAAFISSGKMAHVYRSVYPYSGIWGFNWGNWANVSDRYLGLKFLIGPDTHYGWVRMSVTADWPSLTISATVKDWAYESTPDTAIHASVPSGEVPEPGTLSLLALGTAGLLAWRRRKTSRR